MVHRLLLIILISVKRISSFARACVYSSQTWKYRESRIFRRYGVGREEEWCSIHQNCMSVAISTLPPAQRRVPRLRISTDRSYVAACTRCVLYIRFFELVSDFSDFHRSSSAENRSINISPARRSPELLWTTILLLDAYKIKNYVTYIHKYLLGVFIIA